MLGKIARGAFCFTQPVRLELCLVSLLFCKVRVCKTSLCSGDARKVLFSQYYFARFEFVGQAYFVWYARTFSFALLFCNARVIRTFLFFWTPKMIKAQNPDSRFDFWDFSTL